MAKQAASDEDVLDFIAVVFPEAPTLALHSFDEKHVLRTAAEQIRELRARVAALEAETKQLTQQRDKWPFWCLEGNARP